MKFDHNSFDVISDDLARLIRAGVEGDGTCGNGCETGGTCDNGCGSGGTCGNGCGEGDEMAD